MHNLTARKQTLGIKKKVEQKKLATGAVWPLHHHETIKEIRVEVIPTMGLRGEIDTFETVTGPRTVRCKYRGNRRMYNLFSEGTFRHVRRDRSNQRHGLNPCCVHAHALRA